MLFQGRKDCLWTIKYTNEKLLVNYFNTCSNGNNCIRSVVHSPPMEWLKTVKCTCVEMIFSEFKVGTSMTT